MTANLLTLNSSKTGFLLIELKQRARESACNEANLVGESAVWNAERSGQSEVGQLDASIDVDEKVLRFEIAVNDTVTVAV